MCVWRVWTVLLQYATISNKIVVFQQRIKVKQSNSSVRHGWLFRRRPIQTTLKIFYILVIISNAQMLWLMNSVFQEYCRNLWFLRFAILHDLFSDESERPIGEILNPIIAKEINRYSDFLFTISSFIYTVFFLF